MSATHYQQLLCQHYILYYTHTFFPIHLSMTLTKTKPLDFIPFIYPFNPASIACLLIILHCPLPTMPSTCQHFFSSSFKASCTVAGIQFAYSLKPYFIACSPRKQNNCTETSWKKVLCRAPILAITDIEYSRPDTDEPILFFKYFHYKSCVL